MRAGWSRRLGVLAVVALTAPVTSTARGQDPSPRPYVFVADPDFGMEGGVRTTGSLFRLLSRYDDALLSTTDDVAELSTEQRVLAVGGRVGRLVLLDAPLAWMHTLVVHEVFGHGAHARENGLDPQYIFRLPPPYEWFLGDSGEASGFTLDAASHAPERDAAMHAGGIEADYLSAHWIQIEALRRGGLAHYSEMLRYGVARISYVSELAGDQSELDEDQGNDVASYVTNLQQRFGLSQDADRRRISDNLRLAYVWNFLDPTFWMFLYHGVVDYVAEGRREVCLRTFHLGDARVFPTTRFGLTPFGAEHYLDLYVGFGRVLTLVYGRLGSSGLASYGGLGARIFDLALLPRTRLSGELDGWWQPELLLDQRFVFTRENRLGLAAALHAELDVFESVGLIGKLGYKSRGALMGQPLREGFYGYAGISVRP